ncbi:hypothetical protein HNY73_011172 [Argiope bruennichi]|uniref:Uncharacterized protein n=1 Tax=Argiope bruennichi TaxID=94029 RepID=A0A8T0F3B4_ARGBR|nr:hypothetical protein HNY73_011172 [Argiope bruennichi]
MYENLVDISAKKLQKYKDDNKHKDRRDLRKKYFLVKYLKKALAEAEKERKMKDVEKPTQERVAGPATSENTRNSKRITEDELTKQGELQQHRVASKGNYEYVPNCEWILQSDKRSLLSSTSLNSFNRGDLEGQFPAEIPEEDFKGPLERSNLYANIQKNETDINQYIQEFCRDLEQSGEIPEDFNRPEESRMYGDIQNNKTDINQYIDEFCHELETYKN